MRLRKQLGTEYLTGSIIIEARFPGASTRLRPAWCLPRQAGFSFGNKRSWLELAYRVVPTQLRPAQPRLFSPPKPRRAGCAWRKRTMDKPTEDQIRQRAHELWEQSHRPDGRDDEFWNQAERELQEAEDRGNPAKEIPDDI